MGGSSVVEESAEGELNGEDGRDREEGRARRIEEKRRGKRRAPGAACAPLRSSARCCRCFPIRRRRRPIPADAPESRSLAGQPRRHCAGEARRSVLAHAFMCTPFLMVAAIERELKICMSEIARKTRLNETLTPKTSARSRTSASPVWDTIKVCERTWGTFRRKLARIASKYP